MGLLDKIFGRKSKPKTQKKNEHDIPIETDNRRETQSNRKTTNHSSDRSAPKKKEHNYFLTNSQDHDLGEIELGITGKLRVDGLLAIAAMEKIAKKNNESFTFNVLYTSLLDGGALTVPVVCAIGEKKYSIYFIYQEEELLKYKDLVNHIEQTSYPNLIYFSSIPIYEGYEPKSILEPFQLADLRYDKDSTVAGKYAMWWSTERDPYFHKSKAFSYLSKLNEFIKGYESYMAGYVLRQTKIIKEVELKRILLPIDHMTYIIDGPEEKKVLLDISKEKGIRFLFHIDETTVEYRDRFIQGAVVDLIANIVPLKQHEFPLDEVEDPNSYDWFNFMSQVIKQKEEEEQLTGHQIGLIDFNVQMN